MTTLAELWQAPPDQLLLPNDEIHVWRASLDQPLSHLERLAQTLSADERKRAESFHFQQDRERFIVGRGLLRRILGGYLRADPSRLHFRYGPRGKPAVAERSQGRVLYFNLSHSHGLALYAVNLDR